MKRKSGNWMGEVPYDPQTGTVLSQEPWGGKTSVYDPVNRTYVQIPVATKPNHTFQDTLSKFAFHRGQHSTNVSAESSVAGRHHTIFLADFEVMIPFIVDSKVTGTFTYTKRGTKYATKLDMDFIKQFFAAKGMP